MLDTSALLAALVPIHTAHRVARPHLPAPERSRLPGIVLAETYGRLRGEPFRVSAQQATAALQPWFRDGEVLETPAGLYRQAFDDAVSLNLGGQIHDYLIALTCVHHGCSLVTSDKRQAELATPLFDAYGRGSVTLLAPAAEQPPER